MCGIAGLAQRSDNQELTAAFTRAAEKHLFRRGPDGFSYRDYQAGCVRLLHARLSIIDLEHGWQPLEIPGASIVFNGEIYNYQDLRRAGENYATQSDTEVLLRGLQAEGVDFLRRCDGMFGVAVLDNAARTLTLARDSFGIKQLYYYADKDRFAFASTIAPLMVLSKKEINQAALAEYYLTRACRAPNTVFSDIHELKAGEALVFDLDTFAIKSISRWAPVRTASRTITDEAEAIALLDRVINQAIDSHLVADVPVATLLSGGVDYSLITALAAKRNPDINAFSLGFRDTRFDESGYAAALCQKAGIKQHLLMSDAAEFLDVIEQWPLVMDDPVADPSAVMLYKIAQFARDKGFKVVLSGEGADELFGGYNQYGRFNRALQYKNIGRFIGLLPLFVKTAFPAKTRHVHYLKQLTTDPHYYGTGMIVEPYLLGDLCRGVNGTAFPKVATFSDALLFDQENRLPDDLLTRTDRATMHASIEARVPFLTPYLGDAAASIDTGLLIKGGVRKYILKKYSEASVPYDNLYRPKVGFDLPLAGWFRGTLKSYVLDNLSSTWQGDYLHKPALQKMADEHMSGKNNNADKLWAFALLENNVRQLKQIV
jgi:asparagine synthase (glutamine-hydrolysing)